MINTWQSLSKVFKSSFVNIAYKVFVKGFEFLIKQSKILERISNEFSSMRLFLKRDKRDFKKVLDNESWIRAESVFRYIKNELRKS